jgi:hypothetical protein
MGMGRRRRLWTWTRGGRMGRQDFWKPVLWIRDILVRGGCWSKNLFFHIFQENLNSENPTSINCRTNNGKLILEQLPVYEIDIPTTCLLTLKPKKKYEDFVLHAIVPVYSTHFTGYRYLTIETEIWTKFEKQCCGTGTFCLSGSGTGFTDPVSIWIRIRHQMEWQKEVKKSKNEMPTFWAAMLLLTLRRQDFVQNYLLEKLRYK